MQTGKKTVAAMNRIGTKRRPGDVCCDTTVATRDDCSAHRAICRRTIEAHKRDILTRRRTILCGRNATQQVEPNRREVEGTMERDKKSHFSPIELL